MKKTDQCCGCCKSPRKNRTERYHYDHLSMFDKSDSICSMIMRGDDIQLIYEEEAKCTLICIQCHDIITKIEHLYVFTRAKTALTIKLNNEKITPEEHKLQTQKWNKIYCEKMHHIYDKVGRMVNKN